MPAADPGQTEVLLNVYKGWYKKARGAAYWRAIPGHGPGGEQAGKGASLGGSHGKGNKTELSSLS